MDCTTTFRFANLEIVKQDNTLYNCLKSINGSYKLLSKYVIDMNDDNYDAFYNRITDVASEFSNKNFKLDFATNILTSCALLDRKIVNFINKTK